MESKAVRVARTAGGRYEPGVDQAANDGARKSEQLADFAQRIAFAHDVLVMVLTLSRRLTLAGLATGLGFRGDLPWWLALARLELDGSRLDSSRLGGDRFRWTTLRGSFRFFEARA